MATWTARDPQHGVAAHLLGLVSAATFAALSIAVLLTHPHRGDAGDHGPESAAWWRGGFDLRPCHHGVTGGAGPGGRAAGLYKSRLDSLLFILSINGLLTVLIWLHARSLNRVDVIRHEAEARIERSRAMLAQAEQLAHLGAGSGICKRASSVVQEWTRFLG